MIRKYIGNPGTGKTTALIEAMMASGVPWKRILFCSFTKTAVGEARDRSQAKGAAKDDLKHFRTLHSLAFQSGGNKDTVVSDSDMRDFCVKYGYQMKIGERGVDKVDDFMLKAYEQARNRMIPIATFVSMNKELSPYIESIIKFSERYEAWKEEKGIIDFFDMIENAISKGRVPDVDLAVFDEFQDCSPLLAKYARLIIDKTETSYLAGDYNQAIHEYMGTTPEIFRDFPCDETIELKKSWRVPEKVAAKALSLIRKNSNCAQISWEHSGFQGKVLEVYGLARIADGVKRNAMSGINKRYFYLGRTNAIVDEARANFRALGTPCGGSKEKKDIVSLFVRSPKVLTRYDLEVLLSPLVPSRLYWERGAKSTIAAAIAKGQGPVSVDDLRSIGGKTALIDAIKRGSVPPGVKIDPAELRYYSSIDTVWGGQLNVVECLTIHGSKGREADVIFLSTETTKRIKNIEHYGSVADVESERRVWYVALTRAKEAVILVENGKNRTSII